MRTLPPTAPVAANRPARFRATVHGTIFGGRERHLASISSDDRLLLIPDPPCDPRPGVWVHLPSGDPVGYLPLEIAHWLVPWIYGGGLTDARVVRVRGPDSPSWNRLLIEVTCRSALLGHV